jgi:hypothetical protein
MNQRDKSGVLFSAAFSLALTEEIVQETFLATLKTHPTFAIFHLAKLILHLRAS